VYKDNVDFSQVTTTLGGGLAVGAMDGSIRLFKDVGPNAKTLLPGLGSPITHLDTSPDG